MQKFHTTLGGQMIIGAGIIILLLLGYYFLATSGNSGTQVTPSISVLETDHVRGKEGASVTIVEFGDFECPACAYYEPVVQGILATYPDDVRLVFRNFPLYQIHRNAILAASYAEAASLQNKFWEYHDLLYVKQDEWKGSLMADELFRGYGTALSLDVEKLSNDAKSDAVRAIVEAHVKEGAKLGVKGTPTFFLNGEMIESSTLESKVKEAVAKAKGE